MVLRIFLFDNKNYLILKWIKKCTTILFLRKSECIFLPILILVFVRPLH